MVVLIQTYDLIFKDVAFAEMTDTGRGKFQEVCHARAMNLLRTTPNDARTLRFCWLPLIQSTNTVPTSELGKGESEGFSIFGRVKFLHPVQYGEVNVREVNILRD